MSDSNIKISQGFEILPPKSGAAYPISCDEWQYLKEKISAIANHYPVFDTIGWLLIGAALSILIQKITGPAPPSNDAKMAVVARDWIIGLSVCGILCLWFAWRERKAVRVKANDVVAQMNLIEKRFEPAQRP